VTFVDCPMNQYRCPNAQCIMSEWLCDGQSDCPNAEDESSCGAFTVCTSNVYYCPVRHTGSSVLKHYDAGSVIMFVVCVCTYDLSRFDPRSSTVAERPHDDSSMNISLSHSRSLKIKVIRNDTLACKSVLVFRCNYVSISYCLFSVK